MNRFFWIAAAIILAVGMTTGASAADGPVTFTKDVAPILQDNCQNCHRPGQIGPMSLLSYDETRPWAASIKKQVGSRKMPPYFAHPSSFAMKGDMNLTPEEIETVVAWVDQGAKRGNPAEMPAPKKFTTYEGGWQLKQPDVVMQPLEPFTVSADSDDLYQCFAIPFGMDHDVWLKGVEFQPGNSKVVHHFILFEDKVGRFKALDDATPEPGCECADMDKVLVGTEVLKMWAPGNVQPLSPVGIGNRIAKGSSMILQIHYSNTTGEEQTDQSRFALHLAMPDETIMKETRMQLVNQGNINITAGDPKSRHEAVYTTNRDVTLYSTGVHMHLRGKSMGMWAQRPDDAQEHTVIWVPNFDFNWQLTYEFEEPWKAPRGTKFTMRSVHDNSANNPHNPDPTKDIHFGLYSNDEMSFSGYGYTLDDEALNITPTLPFELKDNPAVVELDVQTDD